MVFRRTARHRPTQMARRARRSSSNGSTRNLPSMTKPANCSWAPWRATRCGPDLAGLARRTMTGGSMKSKFASGTLSVLSVLFLASVTAAPTPAQETPGQLQVLRNPEVSYPVHSDISPPLSLMATVVSPQQGSHLAPEVRYPKLQLLTNAAQRGLGPLADSALQASSGPLVSTTPGLDLLGVGHGFANYIVPDAPTDVNLAVATHRWCSG